MRVSGFRFMLGLVMLPALVAVGYGAWLVVEDLRETTDMWHGLGVFLGVVFAGAGMTAGVLAAVAIGLARSRPMVARVLGVLLALAGFGVTYPVIVDSEIGWWLWLLPLALLVLAVLPDERPAE